MTNLDGAPKKKHLTAPHHPGVNREPQLCLLLPSGGTGLGIAEVHLFSTLHGPVGKHQAGGSKVYSARKTQ